MTLPRRVLAATITLLAGCSSLPPLTPPAPTVFAAYGDMPYGIRLADGRTDDQVLSDDIAPALRQRTDIPFVIHVGDLARPERACNDTLLRETQLFWRQQIVKPVFYTPGDNEWTDCDRAKLPAPVSELSRLQAVRQLLTGQPEHTPPSWRYQQQAGQPENATWQFQSVRFVTLHVVSKGNGRTEVLLDTPQEAAALADARDRNNLQWLQHGAEQARHADTSALVIAMQYDLFGADDDQHDPLARCLAKPAYQELCTELQSLAASLAKPVLLVHGDTNAYCLDQPFDSRVAPLLWRLNAPGDYSVIDAAVVRVNPEDRVRPFQVNSLLNDQPAPAVCDYSRH